MADWETVKLPKEMVQKIEEFTESQYAKQLGFTSKSQVVVTAIRDFISHYSDYMSYLELVDVTDEVVKIMDHKLDSTIEVKINKKIGGTFCQKHHSVQCEHTEFVWLIPRFQGVLKRFPKVKAISRPMTEEDFLLDAEQDIASLIQTKKGRTMARKIKELLDKI